VALSRIYNELRVLYLREAYYQVKQLTIDFPWNAVFIATGYWLDVKKSEFDSL
jgi:hypothetical protein